jgi:hypothetical protein
MILSPLMGEGEDRAKLFSSLFAVIRRIEVKKS